MSTGVPNATRTRVRRGHRRCFGQAANVPSIAAGTTAAPAPFASTPRTNEKPHWVDPRLVVEVRFNEWTRDGKLRQPVFIGVRDDKDPGDVRRENGG